MSMDTEQLLKISLIYSYVQLGWETDAASLPPMDIADIPFIG